MNIIDIAQKSAGWHQLRKTHLGASDSPVIMSVSPYSTRYDLWLEKLGLKTNEVSNFAIDIGNKFEPVVLADMNLRYGLDLKPVVAEHSNYNFIMASLDGYDADSGESCEIKFVGSNKIKAIKEKQLPLEEHYPQLQHQLMVTGKSKGYYTCFSVNENKTDIQELVVLDVKRNDEYVEKLTKELILFWGLIQQQVAPELSPRDILAVNDQGLLEVGVQYLELQAMLKDLEVRTEAKRAELLKLSGKYTHPIIQAGNCKISRQTRRGAIDYAKVPELKGKDLEGFRKKPIIATRIDRII